MLTIFGSRRTYRTCAEARGSFHSGMRMCDPTFRLCSNPKSQSTMPVDQFDWPAQMLVARETWMVSV